MPKLRLAYFMDQRRVSAAELARRTGVPKQTISDWLAGASPRSISQLAKVAEALGINLDELCDSGLGTPRRPASRSAKATKLSSGAPIEVCGYLDPTRLSLLPLVDPRWEDLLGRAPFDIDGCPLVEILHVGDWGRFISTLTSLHGTGTNMRDCDVRIVRGDGTVGWLRWIVSLLPSRDLVWFSARDVTHEYPVEQTIPDRSVLGTIVTQAKYACLAIPAFAGLLVEVNVSAVTVVESPPLILAMAVLGVFNTLATSLSKGDAAQHPAIKVRDELGDDGIRLLFTPSVSCADMTLRRCETRLRNAFGMQAAGVIGEDRQIALLLPRPT